ncbi:MAG: AAA family ATPase [Betaproteobacteria bacterium]|nr:AAA family ATPase [Betaproteobacteria bacterium]MBK8917689.1 AAA family ATPase [Betaproteobacteria bacterium]
MTTRDPLRLSVVAKEKEFQLYRASDFPDLPEMLWLVEDIFPEQGLLCMYGSSGVGKSFLCLDLAAAVAEGVDWFGHPTQQGDVVYVALEGQAGLRLRVKAWETYHGRPFPSGVRFVFDDFFINELQEPRQLGLKILHGNGSGDYCDPVLVIIDTLNRAAPGSDENSCADMNGIIAGATMLKMTTEAAVLLIHHPGKDATRGLRGHSSLHAALDTVVEVDEDGEVIRWRLAKSKDGENGISHGFKLKTVEFGVSSSGKPRKSCVVESVEGYVSTKPASRPAGAHQQVILDAAREFLIQHRVERFNVDFPDASFVGMPFNDLLNLVWDRLHNVPQSHRKDRARQALRRLCEMGFLAVDGDYITLPMPE